jgi:pimeloyl-ACP methyl ester carboxylesterase
MRCQKSYSRWGFLFGLAAAVGETIFAATSPSPSSIVPSIPVPELVGDDFRPAGGKRRFEDLFQPVRTSKATLSPDGRYLAYTVRENSALSVVVVDVDHPSVVKTKVTALTDEDATPMMANNRERTPAAIRWMRWATPTRLVLETNVQVPFALPGGGDWYSVSGVIIGFDADGSNVKTLVTPRDVRMASLPYPRAVKPKLLSEADRSSAGVSDGNDDADSESEVENGGTQGMLERTPRAVDFVAGDPESLLVRAEDTRPGEVNRLAERYTVNVHTGKMKSLGDELNFHGTTLLLDRQGQRRVSVAQTTVSGFPHRFLYEPSGRTNPKPLDEVAGFAAGPGFSVSPENFFGERAVPVGFAEDPRLLYFASNIGRDTYGLYGLDVVEGKRTGTSFENPVLDLFEPVPGGFARPGLLVFDRFDRKLTGIRITEKLGTTQWVRPEWRMVQGQLENSLPGMSVEIQEWDQQGRRFLVYAHGPTEPGAFYVFDRGNGKLMEFVRRSPTFENTKANAPLYISLSHPAGGAISGLLTIPRHVRLKPAPVVVLCQPEPWLRVSSTYQPAVLALADMGFFVLQINPRSSWGSGRRQRELALNGFEFTQVDDIVTTLDWLEKRFEINRKRIAIMGERRGGYLALRALQLRPERFRCAVAIEPTIDIGSWIAATKWDGAEAGPLLTSGYYGSAEQLKKAPLLDPDTIKGPVRLMSYRGSSGGTSSYMHTQVRTFERALRRRGSPVEFSELNEDYMAELPRAQAEVFREVEEFLNGSLFNFRVDIGETRIKKN